MGKIRIKTLGAPEEEKKQQEETKVRKEGKKARQKAHAKKTKAPGLKGGERLVSMAPSEEELAQMLPPQQEGTTQEAKVESGVEKKTRLPEDQVKTRQPKKRGKKYRDVAKLVEKNRLYSISEALDLVKKTSPTRFDGSVEIHLNTTEKSLSGQIQFPHSTGKKLEVAIINDQILEEIGKGKINFDVLIATPEYMPKVAKFAKVLGPRGLLPNPKAGTISNEPEKLAEKLRAGQMRYKTEPQAPLIHLVIGKVSSPNEDLADNLKALVLAVGPTKIEKLTLSSTMGPGVKVDLTSLS